MSSIKLDERWYALAGEYVLGLLDEEQTLMFETVLDSHPELRKAVNFWEQRLQALADAIPEVSPEDSTWSAIKARLGEPPEPAERPVAQTLQQDQAVKSAKRPVDPADAYIPSRDPRVLRWQRVAGYALAATMVLGSVMLYQLNRVPISHPQTQRAALSLIVNEASQTLWLVDVPATEGDLTITALAPPPIDNNQSHQLWMVLADDAGVQSLGLLPREQGQIVRYGLSAIVLDSLRAAPALAVSLEPAGGSPAAVPSGPVLYQGALREL